MFSTYPPILEVNRIAVAACGATYDAHCGVGKSHFSIYLYIGDAKGAYRAAIRFSLENLPAGAEVTQVKLKFFLAAAGGANHLLYIRAYHTDGQTDPEPDDNNTMFARCISGNLYYSDGTEGRLPHGVEKTIILGGTICDDIVAAKSAVNRFSLAFYELDDDDGCCNFASLEWPGSSEYPDGYVTTLEITYEEAPPPPAVGYSYSDGLVSVQVTG